jgi:hypothetical protein
MLANQGLASDGSPQGGADYDIILTALMGTERGRSFLQEYAQRNRTSETATLLTAIRRIEDLLKSRALEPETPPVAANANHDAAPLEPSPAEATAADIAALEEPAVAAVSVAIAETETAAIEIAAVEIVAVKAVAFEMPGVDFADGDESDSDQAMLPANDATPVPRDPFADIRALSDDEKIALFT